MKSLLSFTPQQFLIECPDYAHILSEKLTMYDEIVVVPANTSVDEYTIPDKERVVIVVADYAQLSCIITDSVHNSRRIAIHIFASSKMHCHLILLGKGLQEFQVFLEGDASEATINGIYIANAQQAIGMKTVQHHRGKAAKSTLMIHGIATDNATVSYEGLIVIDQSAHGTYAAQENKNIVLSKSAHVRSIPSIEVLNNEVECFHGSAISYVDEDHFFYLQARGLDASQARRVLLEQFLGEPFTDNPPLFFHKIQQKINSISNNC
jgi:Fe-S cluster assembly scaffold protein SufB